MNGTGRLIPDPVVVFKVVRAATGRTDGTWWPDPLNACGTLELAAISVAFPVVEAYEGVLLDGT